MLVIHGEWTSIYLYARDLGHDLCLWHRARTFAARHSIAISINLHHSYQLYFCVTQHLCRFTWRQLGCSVTCHVSAMCRGTSHLSNFARNQLSRNLDPPSMLRMLLLNNIEVPSFASFLKTRGILSFLLCSWERPVLASWRKRTNSTKIDEIHG